MPSAFATPALLLLVDFLLDDHTEVDRELGLAHADHIASKQTLFTQTCRRASVHRYSAFPMANHVRRVPGAPSVHDSANAHASACAPPPVACQQASTTDPRPTRLSRSPLAPPLPPLREARRRLPRQLVPVAAVLGSCRARQLPSASAEMHNLRRCMVGRTRP